MFTTEDLDKMKEAFEEWLASRGKSPKKTSGSRGAYKYKPKEPSARVVARRLREQQIANGVDKSLLLKSYHCGERCKKCGSDERYITSGGCFGCKNYVYKPVADMDEYLKRKLAKEQVKDNRITAVYNGEKHYEGLPCKTCGTTLRYLASAGCVKCTKDKSIQRRQAEHNRFHHDTSKLMFIKGKRQLPEVYELCPALAAYPDYVLVFTDQVNPKRLVGVDAMLDPKLLSAYAHLYKQHTHDGLPIAEEEKIVVQYLTFEAMQLAWKLFNQRKMGKK